MCFIGARLSTYSWAALVAKETNEYAPSSYRGRSSERLIKNPDRWAGLAFTAAVLFSTGAVAIAINHPKLLTAVAGDPLCPLMPERGERASRLPKRNYLGHSFPPRRLGPRSEGLLEHVNSFP
jgi:hypothetical protein